MWFKHHRRPSQYLLAAVVCVVIFFALLLPNSRLDAAIFGGYPSAFPVTHGRPSKPTPDQLNSLFLTEEQCRSTFPGLLREVDDAASQGPFRLRPTDSMLQGRIKDGKVSLNLVV